MAPRKRTVDDTERVVPEQEPRRSRRDRNSGGGVPFWEKGAQASSSKSERPALAESSPAQAQNQQKPARPQTGPLRKRKRPAAAIEDAENQPSRKSRKATAEHITSEEEPSRGASRGRPKKSTSDGQPQPASKRRSKSGPTLPPEAPAVDDRPSKRKAKGRAQAQEDPDSQEQEAEARPRRPKKGGYYQLETRTRTVPKSTVESEWTGLGDAGKAGVQNRLESAADLVTASLNFKRDEPEFAAIKKASQHIYRRASRFVFPGGSRARGGVDDQLDYDRVVRSKEALELQLDPLQHSTSLLEKEISIWEKTVAKDYDAIRELETNARQESRDWRDKAKRGHALAPVAKPGVALDQKSGRHPGGIFKDDPDPETRVLMKDLKGHMDSISNNVQQLDGIHEAMKKSKAVLQDALIDRLDSKQYESVLFATTQVEE